MATLSMTGAIQHVDDLEKSGQIPIMGAWRRAGVRLRLLKLQFVLMLATPLVAVGTAVLVYLWVHAQWTTKCVALDCTPAMTQHSWVWLVGIGASAGVGWLVTWLTISAVRSGRTNWLGALIALAITAIVVEFFIFRVAIPMLQSSPLPLA